MLKEIHLIKKASSFKKVLKQKEDIQIQTLLRVDMNKKHQVRRKNARKDFRKTKKVIIHKKGLILRVNIKNQVLLELITIRKLKI